jgi:4-amino-4-deoxy-L-arabinose transferase-like glycosyltransferase
VSAFPPSAVIPPPGGASQLSARLLRRWPVAVALLVAAHLAFGVFGRGIWKPDEPREAAIAARMARLGADLVVPHLGEAAFCEKPPLYYWLAAGAVHALGDTPAAIRLPNFLYAIAGALLLGALANAAGGRAAALAAGVLMGTFYLAYRVEIWIATDALLMLSVAGALLGCYRGVTARRGAPKLGWYALAAGFLAAGFLTKNVVAWIGPALALLALLAWERRWRELIAWELLVAVAMLLGACVPWVLAVAARPEGTRYLRGFFVDNLFGRFGRIGAVGYPDAHPGWVGAYLVDLPVDLLPWTFLIVAAVVAAWRIVRRPAGTDEVEDMKRTAWRFAVAAIVPGFVVLSAAASARDVYAAVLMPGFALLGGLWVAKALAKPSRLDERMIRATAVLLGVVALLLPPGLLVGVLKLGAPLPPLAVGVLCVGWLVGVALAWRSWTAARAARPERSLVSGVACLVIAWSCGAPLAFPVFDRAQNLASVGYAAREVASAHALVLWQPDETIIGTLDHFVAMNPPALQTIEEVRARLVTAPDLRLLARATGGRDTGRRLAELVAASGLTIERRIDLPEPGGRSYVILSPRAR